MGSHKMTAKRAYRSAVELLNYNISNGVHETVFSPKYLTPDMTRELAYILLDGGFQVEYAENKIRFGIRVDCPLRG